jgi:hypothetical protein
MKRGITLGLAALVVASALQFAGPQQAEAKSLRSIVNSALNAIDGRSGYPYGYGYGNNYGYYGNPYSAYTNPYYGYGYGYNNYGYGYQPRRSVSSYLNLLNGGWF